MESVFEGESKPVDAGCEEILLPGTSVANGATEMDEGAIEFLEEHDPMSELIAAGGTADAHDTKAAKETMDSVTTADGEVVELYEVLDDCDDPEPVVEGEEDGENQETGIKRKLPQLPKKRKQAALLAKRHREAEGDEDAGEVEVIEEEAEDATPDVADEAAASEAVEDEKPTSSTRSGNNKSNNVDEKQCRVCTSKADLVSLFKTVERQTVADLLMTICPSVSIAQKDFMPQFICNPCLDNVTIAIQLKNQCEKTERELRKQLSRSKNKVRRPRGYVVIDAPVESEPSEEEEQNDEEFKVSDEASPSGEDDSEDSDFSEKKKRVTKRTRRKSAVTPTPKAKGGKRKSVVKHEVLGSSDEEVIEEQPPTTKKKKRKTAVEKDSAEKPTEFPCDECEQVFTRKLSLVLHKKAHMGGREPISCEVCGKQFKIQGAYRTHLEKHKEEPSGHNCDKCDEVFATKAELRRHLNDQHDEPNMVYQCGKCKRTFVTESRLERHQNGRCPGVETTTKRRNDYEGFAIGKDLFKSVAPMTTTYWSDSFSD